MANKGCFPRWVTVVQAIHVVFALLAAGGLFFTGRVGMGLLMLTAGILVLIALIGGLIVSRRTKASADQPA